MLFLFSPLRLLYCLICLRFYPVWSLSPRSCVLQFICALLTRKICKYMGLYMTDMYSVVFFLLHYKPIQYVHIT
jgi:hypothetical protein